MNTKIKPQLAQFLKEKGFDEPCNYQYEKIDNVYILERTKELNNNSDYLSRTLKSLELISAPTISDVVMWLYEKHGIWLFPEWQRSRKTWLYTIQDISSHYNTIEIQEQNYKDIGEMEFNSITEAYEVGIEYCLKNLI